MRITDCHAHIYSLDELRYPMIAGAYRPPGRTGTIEHLKSEMAANGVERVVAIHTSTTYQWDNRFLTDSARANAPWMVGVCTLNPDDPASPELLRTYVREYNVRGMRSVPGGPNRSRLDHPGVDALWTAAEELGITINPLLHVGMADQLEALLKRHSGLNVVLDHCMYPKGADGLDGETLKRAVALARYPNLHAKLTWLVDSSSEAYPFEDTYPLLRAIIDAYGPDRCLWGSDFPCELWIPKATYTQHLQLFSEALGLSDGEKQAILEGTPGRLWFGD